MGGPDEMKEGMYSADAEVDRMAEKMVAAIKRAGSGEPDFGGLPVEKLRKKASLAMKAHPHNPNVRFRPGSRLRTYTGARYSDGTLKDETHNGEAYIKEGTTIYRNIDPIRYPEEEQDPSKRQFPIKGKFEDDGTFVEDIMGPETLYNEYATDNPGHPKKKYGIEPKPGVWTEGIAQIPSYLVRIPGHKGEVEVNAANGKKISVKGGDFLVVDALGDGKTSVQGIKGDMKENTYRSWE